MAGTEIGSVKLQQTLNVTLPNSVSASDYNSGSYKGKRILEFALGLNFGIMATTSYGEGTATVNGAVTVTGRTEYGSTMSSTAFGFYDSVQNAFRDALLPGLSGTGYTRADAIIISRAATSSPTGIAIEYGITLHWANRSSDFDQASFIAYLNGAASGPSLMKSFNDLSTWTMDTASSTTDATVTTTPAPTTYTYITGCSVGTQVGTRRGVLEVSAAIIASPAIAANVTTEANRQATLSKTMYAAEMVAYSALATAELTEMDASYGSVTGPVANQVGLEDVIVYTAPSPPGADPGYVESPPPNVGSSGLTGGMIAGIVLGVLFGALFLVAAYVAAQMVGRKDEGTKVEMDGTGVLPTMGNLGDDDCDDPPAVEAVDVDVEEKADMVEAGVDADVTEAEV